MKYLIYEMEKESTSNLSLAKLKDLVQSVLSKTTRTTKLIDELNVNIKYKDVLFYTWKNLTKMVLMNKDCNNIYMLNVLELLEKIAPPKAIYDNIENNVDEEEILGLLKGNQRFVFNKSELRKNVGKIWKYLINRDLTPVIHKKMLFVLLESSYLFKLDNPIFLTDFLMASMNIKGIIGILALEGMAQLMQKHNIEYPNIYGKLYTMFEPDIFHKKCKSRLFYLADIFLSSIYLPESIVASFAKRAARLSLICSAPDIPMILRFIGNLLIRHPGLQKMIHYPDSLEVSEDPFSMSENDPTKTCAAQSMLWEIALLNNHCLPSISSAAKFINFKLPSVEYDLREVLSNKYEDMFESECKKKKLEKPSLNFERPQPTISNLKDDKIFKLWQLN